jgi:hypothetical protein
MWTINSYRKRDYQTISKGTFRAEIKQTVRVKRCWNEETLKGLLKPISNTSYNM